MVGPPLRQQPDRESKRRARHERQRMIDRRNANAQRIRDKRLKQYDWDLCSCCDKAFRWGPVRKGKCSHQACLHRSEKVYLCSDCSTKWYTEKATSCAVLYCFNCPSPKRQDFLSKELKEARQAWLRSLLAKSDPDEEAEKIVDKKMAQKCPVCATLVFKYTGCNHIMCPTCGVDFNYETGLKYFD